MKQLLFWLTIGLFLTDSTAQAQEREHLIVDLSAHKVEITAGFSGAELLLFGATGGKGDVVVVVRGPTESTIVRRKDKKGGIWVNGANMLFDNVPGFFAIAATRRLDHFLPIQLAKDREIGTDFLTLVPHDSNIDAGITRDFREALIRTKTNAGLYAKDVGKVSFLGNLLFRADIKFPANVPVGNYSVDAFLIREGKLVDMKNTPLIVKKIGVEAGIFDFAKHHSLAYGIFAVFIAAFAGWVAGVIFKKK